MTDEDTAASSGWSTGAKLGVAVLVVLGVTVVFTGMLPGFTPVTEGGGEGGGDVFPGILIPLGLGAFTFVFGWREFRKLQLARNTPKSKVRSLAIGAAEIEGQARPVDEPLTSPLTGTGAVLYELEIEKKSRNSQGSSSKLSFRDHVPFRVDDGTGAVRVNPNGAELVLETEETVEVPEGEDPPDTLAEWARQERFLEGTRYDPDADPEPMTEGSFYRMLSSQDPDLVEELSTPSKRRRVITERVLAVDESAYVWGAAHRREGADAAENVRNLEMRTHDGTGTFVVSDGSEADVHDERTTTVAVLLGASAVFFIFAFVTLATAYGLV